MTFDEYQSAARRTQNVDLNGHQTLDHALLGLASEVGEVLDIYKKALQGHPVETEHVIEEMGDVVWHLSELADVLGVRLEDVFHSNIDKLWRRYPEGFDSVRSVNRND